jgi:hypothetical protein
MLCSHSSAKNPFFARQSWQKIQNVEPVTPIDMLKPAELLVNLDYDRSASNEG